MIDRKEVDRRMSYDARIKRRRNAKVLLTKRSFCAMVSPIDVLLWAIGMVTVIVTLADCLAWILRLL